jgi:hypothetical protein
MNYQNDYLVAKTHIDDLVRAAERARMARAARPSKPGGAGLGLVGRLRRVSRRPPAVTAAKACADCP